MRAGNLAFDATATPEAAVGYASGPGRMGHVGDTIFMPRTDEIGIQDCEIEVDSQRN
jgi:hypothetical protein